MCGYVIVLWICTIYIYVYTEMIFFFTSVSCWCACWSLIQNLRLWGHFFGDILKFLNYHIFNIIARIL